MESNNTIIKKQFSRILQEYRLKNELSRQQVIDYLVQNQIQNIRPKTFYSWENGQTLPCTYTFLQLCRLYHIEDILNVFELYYIPQENNPLSNLSHHEKELLLAYRSHPEMHFAVQRLLGLK